MANISAPGGAGISRSSTFAPGEAAPAPTPPRNTEHNHHEAYGPAQITFVPQPSSRPRTRANSIKDSASSINCQFSDDHKVLCYSDLFQPPVVRQWLQDGKLYREAEERIPSRFELFFDLLLVGVVHQLADTAAENVSGLSVLKVVLTFYPAWSIWADLRNWLNQSGVDDISQRINTLATMICLIGYSANASAIEVGHHAAVSTTSEGGATLEAVHRLLVRATEAAATGAEAATAEAHEGQQRAVVAAITFFLVAKAFRIMTCFYYAWELSDFRAAHLVRGAGLTLVSLIFMGGIFTDNVLHAGICAAVGIFVEIVGRLSIGITVSLERRKGQKAAKRRQRQVDAASGSSSDRQGQLDAGSAVEDELAELPLTGHTPRMIPAINIEHMIERNSAFVTVVLGESVVSLLYIAGQGSIGASHEFGRAVFALIVTFIFNAIYFDSALSKRFVHAIRRHWATNVVWDVLTWPMSTGFVLSSAAVSKLVGTEEVPQGVRWQYGGGLGVALLCITATGLMHRSLDAKGASKLNVTGRAVARVAVSLIFILVPLVKHISDLDFLLTYAGVASALVIFEIWAKLGNEEVYEEDHHPVDVDEQDAIEEARDAVRELQLEQERAELAQQRSRDKKDI
ncbi:hypothetical protein T439DRAFT_329623 [Meredithblackwellia eburnea MCA 4105]